MGPPLDPRIAFPEALPISAHVEELAAAIAEHPVVIVAGETGSGKTTQLPKIALAMGRGDGRFIGCTQPRRIAATSVANRVAEELGTTLGDLVGYKIRFSDKLSPASRVKFMTDGILLAEIERDPLLRRYDTLVIDEAHERSLNIDFLLGFVKRLLPRRPELRVVISSATLEIERFAQFFGAAPVVAVSGRTYPVDVIYRPPTDAEGNDLAETVANAVNEITELDARGDVLVFLPGEREIREAMDELHTRALPHTTLLPLYARLSAAEQQRVFQPGRGRRVVLATNVAETSLTIPGIAYVVDAGVARINRYDVRTGVSQLLVEPVSRASADQRKGRCGRVQSGVCFRLYEEQDYATRPAYTDPEIKRTSLAGVILRMKALGLGDIEAFPFLDPPHKRAIGDGYRVLEELGAIDDRGDLTDIGQQLGRLPLDPRLGRMILAGRDEAALRETVIITAALGLQDPRERPLAAQQQADEAHRAWRDEGSDFAGYLKLWAFYQDAKQRLSRRQLQRACREKFLSYFRMREWDDIHDQLVRILKELEFQPNARPASGEQLHRALLPGLLGRIGMWNPEARCYFGARQTRFVIHPSSGLSKKPPPWVMAGELVETSQLFARTCARLDPVWVERAAGPLCRRNYSDPHWEQKQAQVMAREQITVYGLPIVKHRPVAYAAHDPALCRELFITHALVRHEYQTRGRFMEHNRRLAEEAHRMRQKARRSDMFADEAGVFEFFDSRLGREVVSGKTFEQWRAETETRDPHVLELSLDELLLGDANELTLARFPDELALGGARLPLAYRFEPGEADDGVTITIPLAVLPQLDPEVMAWTIPGWHAAKLEALLDALPKAQRKAIAQARSPELLAAELAAQLAPFSAPMRPALERAVLATTGERITRDAWDLRALPPYLASTFRVVDAHDKMLGADKDLAELQRAFGARAKALWAEQPHGRAAFERTGLRTWDFGALPATIAITVGGKSIAAYPALVDAEHHVDLRLVESPTAARAATRDGLRRLFLFGAQTSLGKLEAALPAAFAKDQRRLIALRALDEAFALADSEPPRDRDAFDARLVAGRARLPDALGELVRSAHAIAERVAKIAGTLGPLTGKPGIIRAFVDDVSRQLAHLAPPDLMRTMPLARQRHVVRYLDALIVRAQRQALDPAKDAQKAAPLAPLWADMVARRGELLARGHSHAELDELWWLFEELRVATFAPEHRPSVPVTLARVQERWALLTR